MAAEKVGGYTTVPNPGAPEYLQLATFAVSEYNKKNNLSLTLESVFRVDTQVVAGVNYKLFLTARDERRNSNNYAAVVYSQAAPTSLQLTSFDPLLK
ncbi:cysteine proteinase inhibitor 5-like [Salvia divinorum]|uniref:Cysteine proteinase inhibitor 5-like n=1 Tax=Salvia divinorum TaxID=28513 RepID=A0ABD1GEE5_SALDI